MGKGNGALELIADTPASAHLAPVPVSFMEIVDRLDNVLRQQHSRALIKQILPGANQFEYSVQIFECELKDRGVVRELTDVVARAMQLGVLDLKVESVVNWSG